MPVSAADTRITSYNVCYTKLLRLAHGLVFITCLAATCYALSRGRRRIGVLFAILGSVVALVALFKSEALLALFGYGATWLSAALVPVASS